MCVEKRYRCDGMKEYACKDGSDESKCEADCPEGMWKCKDNVTCISSDLVCDGNKEHWADYRNQCPAGSDEDFDVCQNRTCDVGLWKCHDRRKCIFETSIMDRIAQCDDGSDEIAHNFIGRTCIDGRHKTCDNGQCILAESWCDGRTFDNYGGFGCQDGSDEGPHCKQYDCLPHYWKCADNLQCIQTFFVCRRNYITYDNQQEFRVYGRNRDLRNCTDKSDENMHLCGCPGQHEWPCSNGEHCVKMYEVCDGTAQCQDTSDEDVSFCREWTCLAGLEKCHDDNTRCAQWCNGKKDCKDGSDEMMCHQYDCTEGLRKCADNLQCIKETEICDIDSHCNDGSDELCAATCLESKLTNTSKTIVSRCSEDSRKCFPIERYCDKIADCPHGSDEADSNCKCEDWGMHECQIDMVALCIYPEWLIHNC